MKTIAVAAALAALAPADAVSVVDVTIVVPSIAACAWMATRGEIKYFRVSVKNFKIQHFLDEKLTGKSAVPDPQPYIDHVRNFLYQLPLQETNHSQSSSITVPIDT
jgi:hypothetical protein